MKTLIKILLLTSVFLLALFSCKKEQLEIGKTADPCECASEVSADFEIREELITGLGASQNEFTLTDNILGGSSAYFKAKLDDAEYKWYIGADVEFDQETMKHFANQWNGQDIPITLVVKKEPNKICFPNDDGYDSITKIMHVYDYCDTTIMEGVFRVAERNSVDSFDIVLDFELAYNQNGVLSNTKCTRLDFYNYDRNGSNCVGYDNSMNRNYREFKRAIFSSWGGSQTDCDNIYVRKCILDLQNRFYIDYSTGFPTTGGTTDHYLYGRKLN